MPKHKPKLPRGRWFMREYFKVRTGTIRKTGDLEWFQCGQETEPSWHEFDFLVGEKVEAYEIVIRLRKGAEKQ